MDYYYDVWQLFPINLTPSISTVVSAAPTRLSETKTALANEKIIPTGCDH